MKISVHLLPATCLPIHLGASPQCLAARLYMPPAHLPPVALNSLPPVLLVEMLMMGITC